MMWIPIFIIEMAIIICIILVCIDESDLPTDIF